MDLMCVVVPGIGIAVLVVASVVRRMAETRQARWNWSMYGSYLYVPPAVFVPGEPVVLESVPVSDETSSETFVERSKAAKERQRAHAKAMAQERADRDAAAQLARRLEMDAVIRQAYESLGKDWQE